MNWKKFENSFTSRDEELGAIVMATSALNQVHEMNFKLMTPGYRSLKTGMCLQRGMKYNTILGFHTDEKLDSNTKYLVQDESQPVKENFKKVELETCKINN